MPGDKRLAPDSPDGKMGNAPKKAKTDDQLETIDAGGEGGHVDMDFQKAEKSWTEIGVFFRGLENDLTQKDEQIERLRKEKDDEISKLRASREKLRVEANAKIRAGNTKIGDLKARAEKAEKALQEHIDELNRLASIAMYVVTSDLENLSDNVKRLDEAIEDWGFAR